MKCVLLELFLDYNIFYNVYFYIYKRENKISSYYKM